MDQITQFRSPSVPRRLTMVLDMIACPVCKTLQLAFATGVLLLAALDVSARASELRVKLTASDGVIYDDFGESVAVSGRTALIGARGHGAAYLFDTVSGQELFKLTPSDSTPGNWFGRSVALSGNLALVGAPFENDSGAAYLFDIATGQEIAKLTSQDVGYGDRFGWSVAIQNNSILIGAPFDDHTGAFSGSVYVFDATTELEIQKLTASDATDEDNFGTSLAVSGNKVIVGAPATAILGLSRVGAAYIFDLDTGQELFKLSPANGTIGNEFGADVALSDDIAIIGSPAENHAGDISGAAYLFDTITGQELYMLTANDAMQYDQFGRSVSVSGNTGLVGSFRDDTSGGATSGAYLFDAETGLQRAKLTAYDAQHGDHFGSAVALSDTTALVGAPASFLFGVTQNHSGNVYVFNVVPEPSAFILISMAGILIPIVLQWRLFML